METEKEEGGMQRYSDITVSCHFRADHGCVDNALERLICLTPTDVPHEGHLCMVARNASESTGRAHLSKRSCRRCRVFSLEHDGVSSCLWRC